MSLKLPDFGTELQKLQEIERVARLLCKAAEPSVDPESLHVEGEPYRVHGGYILDTRRAHPLWTAFVTEAWAIIDDWESHHKQSAEEPKIDEVGEKLTGVAQEAVEIAQNAVEAVENWKDRLGLK
jgi:hypothetical protein